jgi:hypothetical protein
MASKWRAISRRFIPMTAPYSSTFSRPVSSGLNPAPSSMTEAMRPITRTSPALGA